MFKNAHYTYVINFSERQTDISAEVNLVNGIPCIKILELETTNDKILLQFHDKKSVEELMLALQTVKDEMDRFDMNNQSVS